MECNVYTEFIRDVTDYRIVVWSGRMATSIGVNIGRLLST